MNNGEIVTVNAEYGYVRHMMGSVYVTASVVSGTGVTITSEARIVHVFAPFIVSPLALTLPPNATVQLSVQGGPALRFNLRSTFSSDGQRDRCQRDGRGRNDHDRRHRLVPAIRCRSRCPSAALCGGRVDARRLRAVPGPGEGGGEAVGGGRGGKGHLTPP